ncbi:MAG: NAD-dependent epimerase/dehydratase family protein [Candidatus Bathyarchaeia archaeon]
MRVARALVTGGAGYIGSHLVDRLMEQEWRVRVVDNLSSGSRRNIQRWFDHPRFEFLVGDLKDAGLVERSTSDVEMVFHLASNPEVRVGEVDPSVHFRENLLATFNVLEAMRESGKAKTIVYYSTSTVYGEPELLPTPEDYGPLLPISTYGASKLGSEALISAYCHTFDLRALILRVANVVGGRQSHGVIVDFIRKLRDNPKRLEILGDGTQKKSYLFIDDCIDATLIALERFAAQDRSTEVYNIGSPDQVGVRRIAEIIIEEMGLKDVKLEFLGGPEGRGWKGDVKTMMLSVDKIARIGWRPRYSSEEAVKVASRQLLG